MAGEQNDRTRCYGRLLELKKWGGGWIEPLQEIDHPSAKWNRGHIYLTRGDVRHGHDIKPGDVVAFYLYADKKGLGAEDCVPVRAPPTAAIQAAQALQAAQAAAALPGYGYAPPPQMPSFKPPPGLGARPAAPAVVPAPAPAPTPTKPEAAAKGDSTGVHMRPQAPPYKPSLCEALGLEPDGSGPMKQWAAPQPQAPEPWASPEKLARPPLGPPPGFAPRRDNFSVNFDLLCSDDEDEDEDDDFGSEEAAKTEPEQLSDEATVSDGAQSVCGSFTKSSMGDASTCAGFSDRRSMATWSTADSEIAASNPTTPASPAKCVQAFVSGLAKMNSAEVFSDDDSDDEPLCEPTPGGSAASSPEVKVISVPDPGQGKGGKILPAGYKIYMI
jgi:hypothetical protein